MPRETMGDRKKGWMEFTLRLTDVRLRDLIVETAIDLGWSMDSVARRALAWAIEQHAANRPGMTARQGAKAYALVGGHEPEISRRKPKTLRASGNPRLAVRYPPEWQETLERYVEDSVLHHRLAPLWREAIVGWLDSNDAKKLIAAAKKAALAA